MFFTTTQLTYINKVTNKQFAIWYKVFKMHIVTEIFSHLWISYMALFCSHGQMVEPVFYKLRILFYNGQCVVEASPEASLNNCIRLHHETRNQLRWFLVKYISQIYLKSFICLTVIPLERLPVYFITLWPITGPKVSIIHTFHCISLHKAYVTVAIYCI